MSIYYRPGTLHLGAYFIPPLLHIYQHLVNTKGLHEWYKLLKQSLWGVMGLLYILIVVVVLTDLYELLDIGRIVH